MPLCPCSHGSIGWVIDGLALEACASPGASKGSHYRAAVLAQGVAYIYNSMIPEQALSRLCWADVNAAVGCLLSCTLYVLQEGAGTAGLAVVS
jgi:hypothetical protein